MRASSAPTSSASAAGVNLRSRLDAGNVVGRSDLKFGGSLTHAAAAADDARGASDRAGAGPPISGRRTWSKHARLHRPTITVIIEPSPTPDNRGREPAGAAGMTAKRGPKWPWFSALRGPESGLADKMKQIEAPNRGQNPKEYPRNLGNPPLPRARVRASKIGGAGTRSGGI